MSSRWISEWLSNIQPEESSPPPSKRRKLSQSERPQQQTKSDPLNRPPEIVTPSHSPDNPRLKDSPSSVGNLEKMDPQQRSMPPPPSPAPTASRRASSEASNTSLGRSSSFRAPEDKITSSGYRRRVLEFNDVNYRRHSEALPLQVAAALTIVVEDDAPEEEGEPTSKGEPREGSLSYEKATAYVDAMYELETEDPSESSICKIALDCDLFPGYDFNRGLKRKNGMPFKKEGLPRSKFPEFPSISGPSPDFSYGYNAKLFSLDMMRVCQRPLFQPSDNLYFPFLIIEVKSQPMGTNVWQAANQCAGGGTVCVNALACLKDLLGNQEVPEDVSNEIPLAFSLAMDTVTAWLHIHWREGDKFYVQRVKRYSVDEATDVARLHTHLRNIIEWGLRSRLSIIRKILSLVNQQRTTADSVPVSGDADGLNLRKRPHDGNDDEE
ncbi:MAG: hypothetical protein Q9227_007672 [Pyrenula ochraceoflavens]